MKLRVWGFFFFFFKLTFFLVISQANIFRKMNSQNVTAFLKPCGITFTCNTFGKLCYKLQKMEKPEMLKRRVYYLLLQGNVDPSPHGREATLFNQEAYL